MGLDDMTTFAAEAPAAFTVRAPRVFALYLETEEGQPFHEEDGLTIFEIEESPSGTAWATQPPAIFEARA
jgi:hypothetical protein